MGSMYLFTWNVRKKLSAFKLGVQHLAIRAKKDPCVGAFQEAPLDAEQHVARYGEGRLFTMREEKGLVLVRNRMVSMLDKKVESIVRPDDPTKSIAPRMLIAQTTVANQSFTIACVHSKGRMHSNDSERALGIASTRGMLRVYEQRCQEAIIMGDFNANPYYFEMCSEYCWHAVRERGRLLNHEGAPTGALYNPMWRLLPEPTTQRPAFGTHFYGNTDNRCPWTHYDQILISHGLVESARPLRILTHLKRQKLVTKLGRPRKDVFSDHLPVELEMQTHAQQS